MQRVFRFLLLLLVTLAVVAPIAVSVCAPVYAQLPFYTDDSAVTNQGTLHFEVFNEYDALQHAQHPDLRQNTDNFKINYGLPFHLELDVDFPYLGIYRAAGVRNSLGLGDMDVGIKWNFHQPAQDSHAPALSSSLYIESPTGNVRQQLGSGLTDYWLNFIVEEPLSEKTRININLGFLFAGNTTTGALGIESRRGHVFTGGASFQHDMNSRLTLGGEIYGGIADDDSLGRSQLQAMVGGEYAIRDNVGVGFGVIGGKYAGSPRIGVQGGVEVDLPDLFRSYFRKGRD